MTIDELKGDFDPDDYDFDALLDMMSDGDDKEAVRTLVLQSRALWHFNARSEDELREDLQNFRDEDEERTEKLRESMRQFVQNNPEAAAKIRKIDGSFVRQLEGSFDDDPNK